MSDPVIEQWKKDTAEKIKDILGEFEASCNVRVADLHMNNVWVEWEGALELKSRKIELQLHPK